MQRRTDAEVCDRLPKSDLTENGGHTKAHQEKTATILVAYVSTSGGWILIVPVEAFAVAGHFGVLPPQRTGSAAGKIRPSTSNAWGNYSTKKKPPPAGAGDGAVTKESPKYKETRRSVK
jgi:hypothetical protein